MSDISKQLPAPDYWTTLSEYERDETYLARLGEEFHPGAKPQQFFDADGDDSRFLTPMHRRTFLKLSGFAALAAAVAGCERPVQKILPYVHKPEEIIPGIANYYASTCSACSSGCGLLVKTREGRPIKLEGNPDHPLNEGTLCTRGQASILQLYNPDRLKHPIRVDRKGNVELDKELRVSELDGMVGRALRNAKGKVVLLTPTVTGPANKRVIRSFGEQFQNFEHVQFDSDQSGDVRRAHELSFGQAVTPNYRWDAADVVVCIGGDPLAQAWSLTATQRGYGMKRRPTAEPMSRVYVFEPAPTLTGSNADYRYMVHPSQLLTVGLAIAHEIAGDNAQVNRLVANYTPEKVEAQTGVAASEIRRVAKSLSEARGRSIIYCNGAAAQTANGMSLQLLANFLNSVLGNYGSTIDITDAPSNQVQGSQAAMLRLVEEMKRGQVDVLLFHGVNPLYTMSSVPGIAEAFASVKLAVSLDLMMNETVALADIAIPGVHGLENWGDAEPLAGLYSIQQPTIRPIFGPDAANQFYMTRSWQESLMTFAREAGSQLFERRPTPEELQALAQRQGVASVEELDEAVRAPKPISWYDYVRETWREEIFTRANTQMNFEEFWSNTLQLGVVDLRTSGGAQPQLRAQSLASIGTPGATGMVLVAQPSINHGDGESMTNPHMLEMPDPVSKVCWDNYVSIAPALAEELEVKDGDHVSVQVGNVEITGPAYVQPGQHPEVVMIPMGWGRNTFDAIGDNIGINIFPALNATSEGIIASGIGASIKETSGFTKLANIQGHNYLFSPTHMGIMVNKRKGDVPANATTNDDGVPVYERPIIGETTLDEWKKNPIAGYPNHVEPGEEPPSIWEGKHRYVGHHWGMTIDLNTCIGCGACMVACHVENNVPVVGKEEVIIGREMFWIRIDRYYRGPKNNPDFVYQPMLCQHCDNAPCETVCPVVATMHNDEGLNVMVYNRCVGTRYCSNNCPYKVRRFNFWQYADWRTGPHEAVKRVAPLELVLNPDVTTRSRGVMEKCTFCIQRIRNAKDAARDEMRPVRDGDLLTACQQTCPTQAIIFGDRNDPNSAVAREWKNPRAYGLLQDLNTDPSIRYLTLVRNRDEPSPYRTKYQSHRQDHHGAHGDDHTEHQEVDHEEIEHVGESTHAPGH
jgi:molybdopterin-containing oxidoreductase family iron-sulfur binding subunit